MLPPPGALVWQSKEALHISDGLGFCGNAIEIIPRLELEPAFLAVTTIVTG
jgi:hypothetical protein